MKNLVRYLLAVILLVGVYSSTTAQVRKIPAAVTEGFKNKYPNASNVEWKDKLTNFQATFDLDNEKYEARFNKKGEWQDTENEIEDNDLPQVVTDGLKKSKYADWEIEHMHKIELPNDKIQYRIEVSKSDLQKKNLLFNSEGRLLKDKITL